MKLPNMYFPSTSIIPKNTAQFQALVPVMTATDRQTFLFITQTAHSFVSTRTIKSKFLRCVVLLHTVSA